MVDLVNAGLGGGAGQAVGHSHFSKTPTAALLAATPQFSVPQRVQIQTPDGRATQELQQRRMVAMKDSISASLPKFFYPVSDVRFTIYKDSSGQFITSFTNIITGQKTEISEPDLMAQLSDLSGSSFVRTSA
jgi:hypothetical protein